MSRLENTERNRQIVLLRKRENHPTYDTIGIMFPKPNGEPLSRQAVQQICKRHWDKYQKPQNDRRAVLWHRLVDSIKNKFKGA